jgi:hypothetical protein
MRDDEPRPVLTSLPSAGEREIVRKKDWEEKGSARGSVH